jgi:hypothetical protein
MPGLLETITISFPKLRHQFQNQLLHMFEPLGSQEANQLEILRSNPLFLPRIELSFQGEGAYPQAHFTQADGEKLSINIVNLTGVEKSHPKGYQSLQIEAITHRLKGSGILLTQIDHVGINLPWFSKEIHPQIYTLRERLSSICLYHRYPTGEFWDFILPGNAGEITQQKAIDYTLIRKPKFELVSFHLASKPLVQFDIETSGCYDALYALFPEGLADPELRKIWLYTQNPYPIDVCLVLNETSNQDWGDFFRGCRI